MDIRITALNLMIIKLIPYTYYRALDNVGQGPEVEADELDMTQNTTNLLMQMRYAVAHHGSRYKL